jgi:hypothetical protein
MNTADRIEKALGSLKSAMKARGANRRLVLGLSTTRDDELARLHGRLRAALVVADAEELGDFRVLPEDPADIAA